jgi:hypothetical protein
MASHTTQVGDVKVYLLGARKSVLARTQVPIWDIPTPQQVGVWHGRSSINIVSRQG